ncbi:hypothetical protein FTI75_19100, partial [Burkholderia pseudomallei]
MGGESVRARAARPRARRLRATRAVAARRALALRPSPLALHRSPFEVVKQLWTLLRDRLRALRNALAAVP